MNKLVNVFLCLPTVFVMLAPLATKEDTTWFLLSIGIILLWAIA